MPRIRRLLFALTFAMSLGGAPYAAAEAMFDVSTLPVSSTLEADALLEALEAVYETMDVDRFASFFTDDFEQIDINRRVRVKGADKWREWTVFLNGLHDSMNRHHLGRIAHGDMIIVETEWSGRVKAQAAGWNDEPIDYRYRGLIIMEMRGGKIARQTIYADYKSYLEQFSAPQDAAGSKAAE